MPFNAMESINGFITHDTISTASDFLEEDESGVARALSGGIPALINGMISVSFNDADSVFGLVKQSADAFIPDKLREILGGNNSAMVNFGATLLSFLFGSKASTLSNLIAGYAGIKPSSGNTLMTSLAPVVFGVIGIHALSNNLDAQGLQKVLHSQQELVQQALPAELKLPGLWVDASAINPDFETPSAPMAPKWVIPIFVLVLAAAMIFYLFRSCNLLKTAVIFFYSSHSFFSKGFFSH